MGLGTEVVWWRRLLSGLGALVFTLLLTILLFTIRDFRREPNLQWFNGGGGESQVAAYMLIYGGLIVLATYVLFVVPLVLLWPAESQRKRWYAMLSVAMLWPPLLFGIIFRRDRLSILFGEIRHNLGLFGWLELFALCSCCCYLLLIHWQHGRHKARSKAAKIL
jgi:hypothetical protein